MLLHHILILSSLLNQIEALLNKHPAILGLLRVRSELHGDPLSDCLNNHDSLLAINCLSVRLNEILYEVQILMILDILNALLDHLYHVWQQIGLLNSWKQVLIARDGLECVDRLQSYCLLLALEIHRSIEEEYSVPECIILVLVKHVYEVAQEKSIPCADQHALIVNNFVDVVVEGVFHHREDVIILIL